MDIFEAKPDGSGLTKLTKAAGYDAEGSWSPDGKLIAFASNRRGYTDKLSGEEEKNFKIDPAYLNDIYLMNADGSNVRQLTNVPGYDGGPVQFVAHEAFASRRLRALRDRSRTGRRRRTQLGRPRNACSRPARRAQHLRARVRRRLRAGR